MHVPGKGLKSWARTWANQLCLTQCSIVKYQRSKIVRNVINLFIHTHQIYLRGVCGYRVYIYKDKNVNISLTRLFLSEIGQKCYQKI